MPTVNTPSSPTPPEAVVSAGGSVSAGVLSAESVPVLLLLPPQAVRASAMVRARIALIHLLLIIVSFLSGASVPRRLGNVKK